MKVRKNSFYVFNPVLMDRIHKCADLQPGDIVKVIHPNGCPPPNTMGQCHVEKDGKFVGMVSTASLSKHP